MHLVSDDRHYGDFMTPAQIKISRPNDWFARGRSRENLSGVSRCDDFERPAISDLSSSRPGPAGYEVPSSGAAAAIGRTGASGQRGRKIELTHDCKVKGAKHGELIAVPCILGQTTRKRTECPKLARLGSPALPLECLLVAVELTSRRANG
jgi:hypothetical protein